MIEQWKAVPGFENRYEVSNFGNVKSLSHRVRLVASGTETTRLTKERLLKPGGSERNKFSKGCVTVNLAESGSRQVHALVMLAFIGPRPNGLDIAHNDGNPLNNKLTNLRYATRSSNMQDAIAHGRYVFLPEDVRRIRKECENSKRGTQAKLAKIYKVTGAMISRIVTKKAYWYVVDDISSGDDLLA